MTVRTERFEAQLKFLRDHGFQFTPLRDVIRWRSDPSATLPPKTVVLTADDGHRSVHEILLPIAKRENIPVTLFIYPSAISNASYALTWDQLRALRHTGLFDVQSHTWWHPNFKTERRRLAPTEFRRFVLAQLTRSRERIEQELGEPVDMLAWPFGIYDDELTALAAQANYRAGFTLVARAVRRDDAMLALPRYLILDEDTPDRLARRLGEPQPRNQASGGPLP